MAKILSDLPQAHKLVLTYINVYDKIYKTIKKNYAFSPFGAGLKGQYFTNMSRFFCSIYFVLGRD